MRSEDHACVDCCLNYCLMGVSYKQDAFCHNLGLPRYIFGYQRNGRETKQNAEC